MSDRLSEEELAKARQPFAVNFMYVHYDDNGYVVAISNSKSLSNRYYEVPPKRVEPFMLGKRDFTGLKYDYFKFDDGPLNVNAKAINTDILYMIPNDFLNDPDLTVVINKVKKQVKFLLTDSAKKEIFSRNLMDTYKFYFTKKNNYHFLYDTIILTGEKLSSNSYFAIQNLPDEFSLYTIPTFNSYGVILK